MLAGIPGRRENFNLYQIEDFEVFIDKTLLVRDQITIDSKKFLFFENIVLEGVESPGGYKA